MGLVLSAYTAEKKRAIFEQLLKGEKPGEGEFDRGIWVEAKDKGRPQMGTTVYAPDTISVEFVYSDPAGGSMVLKVKLESPERIVFMPVPTWVHQEVWQGHVDGTYRFESEAKEMMAKFELELAEGKNEEWFGKRMPMNREQAF